MKTIPKVEWPKRGQPFHWRNCYFTPGDMIVWRENGKTKEGIVQRVWKNKWGRISYYAAKHDRQIMIEDVVEAENLKEIRHLCVR